MRSTVSVFLSLREVSLSDIMLIIIMYRCCGAEDGVGVGPWPQDCDDTL